MIFNDEQIEDIGGRLRFMICTEILKPDELKGLNNILRMLEYHKRINQANQKN